MKNVYKLLAAATLFVLTSMAAQAHVWYIGWNSNNDGTVDFYGISYHSLSSTWDNFAANNAGIVLNGVQFGFDNGSVVGLSGCSGMGGITGTCDSTWNALGLNDGIQSTQAVSGSTFRKYAVRHMTTADLVAAGIGSGSNTVSFTTFANNVDWAAFNFAPAGLNAASINVNVNNVPEPSALALMGLGLLGLQLRRRKQKA